MEGEAAGEVVTTDVPGKRGPKPTRRLLEAKCAQALMALQVALKEDLLPVGATDAQLRKLAKELKISLDIYSELNQALVLMAIKDGCSAEATPLRHARYSIRADVNEAIMQINGALKEMAAAEVTMLTMGDITGLSKTSRSYDTLDESISFGIKGFEPLSRDAVVKRHCQNLSSSPKTTAAPHLMSAEAPPFMPVSASVRPKERLNFNLPPAANIDLPVETHPFLLPTHSKPLVFASLPPVVSTETFSNLFSSLRLSAVEQPGASPQVLYTNAGRGATQNVITHGQHGMFVPQTAVSVPQYQHPTTIYENGPSIFSPYFTHQPNVTVGSSMHHQHFMNNGPVGQAYVRPPAPQQAAANTATVDTVSAITKCFAQQELMKQPVPIFDGTCHAYRNWKSQVKDHLATFVMKPNQTLKMILGFTSGRPKDTVQSIATTCSEVTDKVLNEIWKEFDERYGSAESIEREIQKKIRDFPDLREPDLAVQLHSLIDLCKVALYHIPECQELESLNRGSGIRELREKLPTHIQRDWARAGLKYRRQYNLRHPPFAFFVSFLREKARDAADDNFAIIEKKLPRKTTTVKVLHTASSIEKKASLPFSSAASHVENNATASKLYCYFHKSANHNTSQCNGFAKSTDKIKQKLMSENGLCFACLNKHLIKDCKADIRCSKCNRPHLDILHRSGPFKKKIEPSKEDVAGTPTTSVDSNATGGGKTAEQEEKISVKCTRLCGDNSMDRNCSRTFLVDITLAGVADKVLRAYALIDDHSNCTLVDEELIEFFGMTFPVQHYTMSFANRSTKVAVDGRLVTNLFVKGVYAEDTLRVERALSCPHLAGTSFEAATPQLALAHAHSAPYSDKFPPFDGEAKVLLLIGRDCGRALKIQTLTDELPYVVTTPLGYALLGQTCDKENAEITQCKHALHTSIVPSLNLPVDVQYEFAQQPRCGSSMDVFHRSTDEDCPAFSRDDKVFIEKMELSVCVCPDGSIQLPLPMKLDHRPLPDNHMAVYYRTKNTLEHLINDVDKSKLESALLSMKNNIERNFVEEVPSNQLSPPIGTFWYLPIFSIWNENKKKLRLVYDASAKYQKVSLNDTLYQGPDLNNQLRGVLLRFREKPVGFGGDIESMFNMFRVPPNQRDLLRYYWFKDNDPTKNLVPYRSCSHIFGCTSSPAVAIYALKYCAEIIAELGYEAAKNYIMRAFYVDDGLFSVDTVEEAIDIMEKARKILQTHNIRLHKLISNDSRVLAHFPASECAVDPTRLELQQPSIQRTLGVSWDTQEDVFVMRVCVPHRLFTKRGIVSVINTIYDPWGLASPAVLEGKLLQRKIIPPKKEGSPLKNYDWDDILPNELKPAWEHWTSSLHELDNIKVPRSFYPRNFKPIEQQLHIFCDASEQAIGHVAYLRSVNADHTVYVAYVSSASRVAPRCATSMPRMELCAATEAARAATAIITELERKPDCVVMYTDSTSVLGYIRNESRRLSQYVARRADIIRLHTTKENWHYVNSSFNPADYASRPTSPVTLMSSCWYKGPPSLWDPNYSPDREIEPEADTTLPEEKEDVIILITKKSTESSALGMLYVNTNNFNKLLGRTQHVIAMMNGVRKWVRKPLVEASRKNAMTLLIKQAQQECYHEIIELLKQSKSLPESDNVSRLYPQLDNEGVIRVGGRLKHANVAFAIKHPVLIPHSHPLAKSLVYHYHEEACHQGEHISHGRVRNAGFHIDHGRSLIREVIQTCVFCKRLRSKFSTQLMADLPPDRLEEAPPFKNVGVDVFGHFFVQNGRNTRSATAQKKIWALIFVCLSSRAIHLEPLQGMDTTSFLLALSRFTSLRGTASLIRSDHGTNFIGAQTQLQSIDLEKVSRELNGKNIEWKMSPPHGSHMSGAWERKVGSVRRVLEASMLLLNNRTLSRDEFTTMLAEAASIVNHTPLWTVSNDPNDPAPLTPAMLLNIHNHPCPYTIDDYTERDLLSYGQRQYRRVKYLASQFWKRWREEYLHTLTLRHKWKKKQRCVTPGDIVIVKKLELPRNEWPLARVSSVRTSQDGLVRSVELLVASKGGVKSPSPLMRPITEIVLLVPHSTHNCQYVSPSD